MRIIIKVYARQGRPRPEVAQGLPAFPKSNKIIFFVSSATANSKLFFPAPWLDGKDLEQHPVNIWYWVRERSYSPPRSCAEIQLRGLYSKPLTGKKIRRWGGQSRFYFFVAFKRNTLFSDFPLLVVVCLTSKRLRHGYISF